MSSGEAPSSVLACVEGPIAVGACRLDGQDGAHEAQVERLRRAAGSGCAEMAAASSRSATAAAGG